MTLDQAKKLGTSSLGLSQEQVDHPKFNETVLMTLTEVSARAMAKNRLYTDEERKSDFDRIINLKSWQLEGIQTGFTIHQVNGYTSLLQSGSKSYSSYLVEQKKIRKNSCLEGLLQGMTFAQVNRKEYNLPLALAMAKCIDDPNLTEDQKNDIFERVIRLKTSQLKGISRLNLTLDQVEGKMFQVHGEAVMKFFSGLEGRIGLSVRERFSELQNDFSKEQLLGKLIGLKPEQLKHVNLTEDVVKGLLLLMVRQSFPQTTIDNDFNRLVSMDKRSILMEVFNMQRDIRINPQSQGHILDGMRDIFQQLGGHFYNSEEVINAFNRLEGLAPEEVEGAVLGLTREQVNSSIFINNKAVILKALEYSGARYDSNHSDYFDDLRYLKKEHLEVIASMASIGLRPHQVLAPKLLNNEFSALAINNLLDEHYCPAKHDNIYDAVTRLDDDVKLRGLALGIDPEKVGLKLKGAEFRQLNEETDVALSHALLDTIEVLQNIDPWQSANAIFDEVVELTDIQRKGIVLYGLSLEEVKDNRFVSSKEPMVLLNALATSMIGEEEDLDEIDFPLKKTGETHELFEKILTTQVGPSTDSNISSGVLEENQFDGYLELLAGQIDVHSRLTAPDNLDPFPVQYETKASHKDARESEGAYEGEKKMSPEQKRASQESQQPVLDEQQRREAMDLGLSRLAKVPPNASRSEGSTSIESRMGQKRKGNEGKNTPPRSKKPRFSI